MAGYDSAALGPKVEHYAAHVPQVLPDGSLQIVMFDERDEMPWTVAFYAPGEWKRVYATIPSGADIDQMRSDVDQRVASALAQREFMNQAAAQGTASKTRKGDIN